MFLLVIFAITIGFSHGLVGIGSSQSVSVQGDLACNGEAASGILVKLYDANKLLLDNLLDEEKTNSDGEFILNGQINDITSMNPKVDIFHNCDNGILRCSKKLVINIPQSAINSENTFNIGAIDLASDFKGESHDCIH
uniref:Uncharacterized protein n=1 Tax=Acrobeloides nanus TaxID=290746 RepID=A0A914CXE0_9BILA